MNISLTKIQQKQLEMLSDGEWHNTHNNKVRGLQAQSLDALIRRGLVEEKIKPEDEPTAGKPIYEGVFHSAYDIYYRLVVRTEEYLNLFEGLENGDWDDFIVGEFGSKKLDN